MALARFMVIENFRDGPDPVYARFAEKGRMLPDGLTYLDSWLSADGQRCFQLMEAERIETFDKWTVHWNDLVDFEIVRLGEKPPIQHQEQLGRVI